MTESNIKDTSVRKTISKSKPIGKETIKALGMLFQVSGFQSFAKGKFQVALGSGQDSAIFIELMDAIIWDTEDAPNHFLIPHSDSYSLKIRAKKVVKIPRTFSLINILSRYDNPIIKTFYNKKKENHCIEISEKESTKSNESNYKIKYWNEYKISTDDFDLRIPHPFYKEYAEGGILRKVDIKSPKDIAKHFLDRIKDKEPIIKIQLNSNHIKNIHNQIKLIESYKPKYEFTTFVVIRRDAEGITNLSVEINSGSKVDNEIDAIRLGNFPRVIWTIPNKKEPIKNNIAEIAISSRQFSQIAVDNTATFSWYKDVLVIDQSLKEDIISIQPDENRKDFIPIKHFILTTPMQHEDEVITNSKNTFEGPHGTQDMNTNVGTPTYDSKNKHYCVVWVTEKHSKYSSPKPHLLITDSEGNPIILNPKKIGELPVYNKRKKQFERIYRDNKNVPVILVTDDKGIPFKIDDFSFEFDIDAMMDQLENEQPPQEIYDEKKRLEEIKKEEEKARAENRIIKEYNLDRNDENFNEKFGEAVIQDLVDARNERESQQNIEENLSMDDYQRLVKEKSSK